MACGHCSNGTEDAELVEGFGEQIVNRHAVLGVIGLHDLADLGDGSIDHRVGIGNAEFLLAIAFAHQVGFGSVGERHQRRIAVAQRDAAMAHDGGDDIVIRTRRVFLDVD